VTTGLRIIATGQVAQFPLGGVTWFHMDYLAGLARLGHDVWYLEDSGQWPYNPHADGLTEDCSFNVQFLEEVMARFGLDGKWAYRFPWEARWFGLGDDERREVVETTDLLLNVCGTLERPWEYRAARRLAYVDTDPVFTQIKLARGQRDFQRVVDAHDVHFSYGERPSPSVPPTGHRWIPTRTPVVLSEWPVGDPVREVFTTVMNWTSYNSIEYGGDLYGQKDEEFRRFIDLPGRIAPTSLEIAMASGKNEHPPRALLAHKQWHLVDPAVVCPDLDSYRAYIQGSLAEWSVAKNGYVRGRSGWFSERSARYLAAGRPVVAQETGFSDVFPAGEGVIPFTTTDEAIAGIRAVEANYERHSRAARSIAEEWFDSDKVLSRLIDQALDATPA
jgi:hypothetical protein